MATIIDSRLKYRVGSPMLPALPVVTWPLHNVEAKFPDRRTHLERIQGILDQNGITPKFTKVAYRWHPESELHDKYITITTWATYQPDSDVTWPTAVRQIREYLNQADIHHAIEIIDDVISANLRGFPVATDIYQWNEVLLPVICNLINGRQWTTLDMVYRKDAKASGNVRPRVPGNMRPTVPGNMRPTIVIGARDADEQYWWDEILPAIRQLPQVAQSNIQVELLYRSRFIAAARRAVLGPDAISLQNAFNYGWIELGASCGNGERTGTLGGSMRLKNPDTGVELKFGITNHHVLANQLTGKGPFTTFEDPIKVESPSGSDRDAYIKALKNRIECLRHEMDRGMLASPVRLQALEDELARVQSFDLYVGQVFASSGLRTAQHKSRDKTPTDAWALDWCLTTIDKRATPAGFHGLASIGWKEVIGYCSLDPGQGYRVFKKGRTSGGTAGFTSATESVVQVLVPKHEDGLTAPLTDADMIPAPIRCHVMMGDRRTGRNGTFIEPGDSGSLVLLDPNDFALEEEDFAPEEEDIMHSTTTKTLEGEDKHEALIAGLALGSHEELRLSYMAPMDLVVQDIESVTGWKVVEPTFAGVVKRDKTTSPP
ncbi:hypothetical protein BU26DRAFT_513887 [Trematosphaeria pertusa]|uniref:Uncharacterized protein n=1 Tax=Trematosphaeria pertusa TaxID=390896 RepID=A0A6A6J3A3_9PLEO|nr:uncharacterized protein BU26DRAFT_513887 [Trematosphaeria pertusa]KAF2257189.1 hypothetical protein BU26DRAFT_513887 [Trematosphaeria pertusa]